VLKRVSISPGFVISGGRLQTLQGKLETQYTKPKKKKKG